jgi:hypothetical protein
MEEKEPEVTLTEVNRQLQKDLLSERIIRIDFQMQLLGIMRNEAQQKLQDLMGPTADG